VITQAVEYSLRAIVTLAKLGGRPCTSQQLAELTDTPAPYLSKLLQTLVRGELIQSRRGVNGGFVLARRPEEMTIYDVVQAVDAIKRIRKCPLNIGEHSGVLCPLHRRLDEALDTVERSFRGTTLADLLNDPEGRPPLCERQSLVELSLEVQKP
jgi:Rrf2 family protein